MSLIFSNWIIFSLADCICRHEGDRVSSILCNGSEASSPLKISLLINAFAGSKFIVLFVPHLYLFARRFFAKMFKPETWELDRAAGQIYVYKSAYRPKRLLLTVDLQYILFLSYSGVHDSNLQGATGGVLDTHDCMVTCLTLGEDIGRGSTVLWSVVSHCSQYERNGTRLYFLIPLNVSTVTTWAVWDRMDYSRVATFQKLMKKKTLWTKRKGWKWTKQRSNHWRSLHSWDWHWKRVDNSSEIYVYVLQLLVTRANIL